MPLIPKPAPKALTGHKRPRDDEPMQDAWDTVATPSPKKAKRDTAPLHVEEEEEEEEEAQPVAEAKWQQARAPVAKEKQQPPKVEPPFVVGKATVLEHGRTEPGVPIEECEEFRVRIVGSNVLRPVGVDFAFRAADALVQADALREKMQGRQIELLPKEMKVGSKHPTFRVRVYGGYTLGHGRTLGFDIKHGEDGQLLKAAFFDSPKARAPAGPQRREKRRGDRHEDVSRQRQGGNPGRGNGGGSMQMLGQLIAATYHAM